MKKTAHRKRTTTSSNPAPDDDVDNPDLEVELDSLGLFFMRLIDDDICQDDAEASHADAAKVIILSSDSEPLPSLKIRQANRKVKFSHPLAYLDPNFLMKTQQHETCRTTRHSGQVVTSAGLSISPVRNTVQRSLICLSVLVLKRAAFINLLIHLTPITRLLPTHLLASHRLLSSHRSKRCLGKLYLL